MGGGAHAESPQLPTLTDERCAQPRQRRAYCCVQADTHNEHAALGPGRTQISMHIPYRWRHIDPTDRGQLPRIFKALEAPLRGSTASQTVIKPAQGDDSHGTDITQTSDHSVGLTSDAPRLRATSSSSNRPKAGSLGLQAELSRWVSAT